MAGPRRGPAANRNNGARFARGAWLAFTDDDCLPDPHWLERYAEAMDGEASALEGAIHPLGDWGDLTECPVNLSGGCFWSANIAVRCSTFWQCEGFDENYPLAAHEDQDLQLRLSALTTIRFVADAIVTHPVRPLSFRGAIARIPGRCRVWAFHFHKHRRTLGFASNLSIVLFGCNVHGRLVIEHLLSLHFRSAFVNVLMVLYGAPVMWVHLERLSGAGASEAVAG
jgi:GT2 family glycosyltransferase